MLFMAVGNNRLAGGGFEVAPMAKLDDGLLDLAVINHATGAELMRLSQELETPDNPDNKVLRYWQLPEFTIEAEREVHFNLDGEPTTEHKLHFSVLPKHLGVAF
jgi:diacylglycerol kinase family enzyme